MLYSYVNNELLSADEYYNLKLYKKDLTLLDCFRKKDEVIFKRTSSNNRRAHFAYKVLPDKLKSSGESLTHYNLKCELFEWLIKRGKKPRLEDNNEFNSIRIPDVIYDKNCFEIQISNIDLDTLDKRCQFYFEKGYNHYWYFGKNLNMSYIHIVKSWHGAIFTKDGIGYNFGEIKRQQDWDIYNILPIENKGIKQLDAATKIINPEKFINSHIEICKANNGKEAFKPYYDRLLKYKRL